MYKRLRILTLLALSLAVISGCVKGQGDFCDRAEYMDTDHLTLGATIVAQDRSLAERMETQNLGLDRCPAYAGTAR